MREKKGREGDKRVGEEEEDERKVVCDVCSATRGLSLHVLLFFFFFLPIDVVIMHECGDEGTQPHEMNFDF